MRTIHCTKENPLVIGGEAEVRPDALKRIGVKLPFEGKGIRVTRNADLIPAKFKERDLKVVAKEKAKEAKETKAKRSVKAKVKKAIGKIESSISRKNSKKSLKKK